MPGVHEIQSSTTHQCRDQGDALQRLLAVKGPVRARKHTEQPFLDALEEVLALMGQVDDAGGGWLNGSISGQCWQDFMEQLRVDLLSHLQRYRDGAASHSFSPAALASFKAERQRADRLYIRDLVAVYHSAAQTYKSLSG